MNAFEAQRLLNKIAETNRVLSVREMEMVLDEEGPTMKSTIKRLCEAGVITRACRGVYVVNSALRDDGHPPILHQVAGVAKRGELTYVSLETALSDYGVISQVPMTLTLMTTGRSQVIRTPWGTVEMTHTDKSHSKIRGNLHYQDDKSLPLAHLELALSDLKRVGRNVHLIDEDALREIQEEMEESDGPEFG